MIPLEKCTKSELIKIIKTCESAIEKQIPEKPKKNLDGNLACQCGFVVQNGKRRKCIYYCTYCGQRLDWGGTK